MGALPSGIEVSHLVYRVKPGIVDFYHTETLPEYQGKGYAEKVVRTALEWARSMGYEVRPTCSYVKWLIGRGSQIDK